MFMARSTFPTTVDARIKGLCWHQKRKSLYRTFWETPVRLDYGLYIHISTV